MKVLSRKIFEYHTTPAKYTGELFGVAYLYSQTGTCFPQDISSAVDEGFAVDEGIEEGFEEAHSLDDNQASEDLATIALLSDEEVDSKVSYAISLLLLG